MKIGDRIRVLKIPPDVRDVKGMNTKTIFRLCVGKIFPIKGFMRVPEIKKRLLELEVGRVVGKPPCFDTIWIEPEYVEIVTPARARKKPR